MAPSSGTASPATPDRIKAIEQAIPELEIVGLHPVPFPTPDDVRSYSRWLGDELKPLI
jgi:hypothetical protein